eukprot:s1987_g6.t1
MGQRIYAAFMSAVSHKASVLTENVLPPLSRRSFVLEQNHSSSKIVPPAMLVAMTASQGASAVSGTVLSSIESCVETFNRPFGSLGVSAAFDPIGAASFRTTSILFGRALLSLWTRDQAAYGMAVMHKHHTL